MKLITYLKYLTNHKFKIGFIEDSVETILANKACKINVIKHKYHDRWFADPFILEVTNSKIILLAEEFMYSNSKGRIAQLTIDRKSYKLIANKTILDLPTHLSFPLIRRVKEDIYICPENSAGGELSIYKLSKNSCEKIETILHKPVYDAVDITINGDKYLFLTEGSKFEEQNGNRLKIYKQQGCKYIFYQQYFFNENIARMAGDLFWHEGVLYRPAQECNNYIYGHALSLQKVIVNDTGFDFQEISRLTSNAKEGGDGIHTFNTYKGITVVDVKQNVPSYITKFKKMIHKKLKVNGATLKKENPNISL